MMKNLSEVYLKPVTKEDKPKFLQMAIDYFQVLNPQFEPQVYWKENYLEKLLSNSEIYLEWIFRSSQRLGFALYGVMNHLYMDKKIGVVYDFYVVPHVRKKGVASKAVRMIFEKFKLMDVDKIQLEIVIGNEEATKFWESLNFQQVSSKYVFVNK